MNTNQRLFKSKCPSSLEFALASAALFAAALFSTGCGDSGSKEANAVATGGIGGADASAAGEGGNNPFAGTGGSAAGAGGPVAATGGTTGGSGDTPAGSGGSAGGTGGTTGGSGGTPAGSGGSAGGTGGAAGGDESCPAESAAYLTPIEARPFKIDGPLWKARLKSIVTSWIPYVATKLSDPSLPEGGIENFVQAGRRLAGQSAAQHVGLWFSNAYVLQLVEAMSAALLLDAEGDEAILNAQNGMRVTLADWIPKILSAQESDGYLQTIITLGSAQYGNPGRWSHRMFHEGYVAGYFLEAAIVHTIASGDSMLYEAAKRLADCWVNNIGPAPKRLWWDGHEGMELALVRFARFVDQQEGAGAGDAYVQLAKFLLDVRGQPGPISDDTDLGYTDAEYDQHHTAPLNQKTAVGHAVRAVYLYAGMAQVGVAAGSGDYLTAADSIWDNLVNRKMYVNGCLGSLETNEGFAVDYELPNRSYCESCASCGMVFFQNAMTLARRQGSYADLAEMALYNTVMGSVDLAGDNFEYRNPIDAVNYPRYDWHPCPCCVSNVPRTLLEIARWTYAKSDASLYIDQFVGGTVDVGALAGAGVRVRQETDYPWSGDVSITVNPATPARFAVRIRVPDRSVSTIYSSTPEASGITSLSVNGAAVTPTIADGYASVCRTWTAGDTIDLQLPLAVQRVKAVSQVAADIGRVALQYGPLIYNIESVDSGDVANLVLSPSAALSAQWNGSLLGGVMTITGAFSNGAAMTAIPHYARMNRGGNRSLVWIRDQ
ncbi:MAG: glycoside hydrolase family 127 protein [Deltaproteobacteria bacterium]|nr:glycoside hydrolase family 127 protein [Deltaproteobacteria bacterium]